MKWMQLGKEKPRIKPSLSRKCHKERKKARLPLRDIYPTSNCLLTSPQLPNKPAMSQDHTLLVHNLHS